MNIYIFGNLDEPSDNVPLKLMDYLKTEFHEHRFIEIKPNADLDFEGEDCVYMLDTVAGVTEPTILTEKDIDDIAALSRGTVHDYDLGFQLKYLRKLGRIDKVKILALPMNHDLDLTTFQFIFKKFVEHDMQGS